MYINICEFTYMHITYCILKYLQTDRPTDRRTGRQAGMNAHVFVLDEHEINIEFKRVYGCSVRGCKALRLDRALRF